MLASCWTGQATWWQRTRKRSVYSVLFSYWSLLVKPTFRDLRDLHMSLTDMETSGISKNFHCWRMTRLGDTYAARMNTSQCDGLQQQGPRELMSLQDLSWNAIRKGSWGLEEANVTPFFKKKLQISWSSVCHYLEFSSKLFDTGGCNILPGKSVMYRPDNRTELDWKLPELLGWKD